MILSGKVTPRNYMRRRMSACVRHTVAILCLTIFTSPLISQAATVTVVSLDGPNVGLNDPIPATPIGGNTGATLGAQRKKALQFAADIWGSRLDSGVEVRVGAEFHPLPCDAVS